MPLFHYPKAIHKRKLSPGPYKNYRTYKKHLKIEFDATCVYCRMPDSLSEPKSYAVEHYKPKNQFPLLENIYSNLFYSCCNCNGAKGTFWPSLEQKKSGQLIPNPCDYVMHDHLRSQSDGTINPHSFTGQWAIGVLDLNSPGHVQKRQGYLVIKKNIASGITILEKRLAKLKTIEKTIEHIKLTSIQNDITAVEKELADLKNTIKMLGN